MLGWLLKVVGYRSPDEVIGAPAAPYLRRWHVIPRNRFLNIYLHHFCRSDNDRALHDHPWISLSILLSGAYMEHLQGGRRVWRRAGGLVFRRAVTAHRIVLPAASTCWTLFITGPRIRAWGFYTADGWVYWKRYLGSGNQ